MIVRYQSPNRKEIYETEIPCEADPEPFARKLIEQADQEELRETGLDLDPELRYCFVDGSPLRSEV